MDARGMAGRRGHSVPRAVQQHAPRNASVCGLLLVVLLMKGEREEARRCRRTHTRRIHDENDSTACDVLPYDA